MVNHSKSYLSLPNSAFRIIIVSEKRPLASAGGLLLCSICIYMCPFFVMGLVLLLLMLYFASSQDR